MPAELPGNPPSCILGEATHRDALWNSPHSCLYGMPGRNIQGEVLPWPHSTAKSPERMLQEAAGHWALLTSHTEEQSAGEATCVGGLRHRKSQERGAGQALEK